MGWLYVKAENHSLAGQHEGAAVMGVLLAKSDEIDDIAEGVDQLRSALAVDGIKLDRLKKRLKKPQQELSSESGSIDLWEIGAGNQSGKAPTAGDHKGTALLALAHIATERTMIVLGFVMEPDDQGYAGMIMKSVQSLAERK